MRLEYDAWCQSTPATEYPGAAGEWPYACADAFVDEARGLAVAATGGGGGAVTLFPSGRVRAAVLVGATRLNDGADAGASMVAFLDGVATSVQALRGTHPRWDGVHMDCVALLVREERVVLCATGLCRAYRLRAGRVEQLTEDESLLSAWKHTLDHVATAEEIAAFPYAGIATETIGSPRTRGYAVVEDAPQPGDVYLLCTEEVARSERTVATLASCGAPAPLSGAARALWDAGRAFRPPDAHHAVDPWYWAQAAVALVRVS